MRHALYVLLVSIGLVLSLSLLSFAIDRTGLWRLMNVDPAHFVWFSLAAGWIGGFSCWFLSRSIAIWSLDVKPLAGGHPAVDKVAKALGMSKVPEVATYETIECNAFVVGWLPAKSLVVLSSALLAQRSQEDVEAIVAQRLAAVKNRDVSALILFNGVLNVFTIYPARMLAFLFGTSLRTFTEETPSDDFERGLMAFLEISVAGFASLLVRLFARGAEARADAEAARLFGRDRVASALQATERSMQPKTHREVFIFPLKFAVAQAEKTRWLGYHLPLSVRLRA